MKDLLDKLHEERARVHGDLTKIVAEASAEKRDLTAEERQEFDRRDEALRDFDTRIKQLKDRIEGDTQIDEMRASHEAILRPGVDPALAAIADEEKRTLDFFTGKGGPVLEISLKGLTVVRDGHRNVVKESRAGLVDGTFSAGGATFAPTFRSVLYQHLIFNSAIRQTRATVLTTASGEQLLLPKTTAHPTSAGTITAEGATIGESDPTFGQGTLTAYKYGNLVQVSTELEQDTAVDLLGYLAKAMGRSLGNSSGVNFVTGTGTSQPQGVLVGAGTALTITGGTPASNGATFSELERVYDNVIPPYQLEGEWFMSQTALSKIRSLTNTQGTPIFLPSLSGAQPDTLFGKPIILDPNMPAVAVSGTSIAFGDFSTYYIRDVDGIRFERSNDFAFSTDLVTYRAIIRTDGRLLDLTGSIATYKGGTA